jgi:hypothetical protein
VDRSTECVAIARNYFYAFRIEGLDDVLFMCSGRRASCHREIKHSNDVAATCRAEGKLQPSVPSTFDAEKELSVKVDRHRRVEKKLSAAAVQ